MGFRVLARAEGARGRVVGHETTASGAARIPWLASKKHDIQGEGREEARGGICGLRRFPKIPQASAKSNEQGVERGPCTWNVIPRAPRANYVKI